MILGIGREKYASKESRKKCTLQVTYLLSAWFTKKKNANSKQLELLLRSRKRLIRRNGAIIWLNVLWQ